MRLQAILNNLKLYNEKNVNKFLLQFYSDKLERIYENRYEVNNKPSLCDGVRSMNARQLLDYFTSNGLDSYSIDYDDSNDFSEVVNVNEDIDDLQRDLQLSEAFDRVEKGEKKATAVDKLQAEDKKENVATIDLKNNNNDIVASETKQQ